MSTWRPMGTEPHDESQFFICNLAFIDSEGITTAHWENGILCKDADIEPTHWAPIQDIVGPLP